jgi:hypothetical protein
VELEGIGPSAARHQLTPEVTRPSPTEIQKGQSFNRIPVDRLAFCFISHATNMQYCIRKVKLKMQYCIKI